MKKILHSGDFLDYNGNTIRVSFYEEKHLWISRKNLIDLPQAGCELEVEVWSDAGTANIVSTPTSWINITPITRYNNKDGYITTKYKIVITSRTTGLTGRTASLKVSVSLNAGEDFSGYDTTKLSDTITIKQN